MRSVILITGCSTGIGRAAAIALGRRGHRVYATMRSPERADALRQLFQDQKLDAEILALDVTDDDSVRAAIDLVVNREGRLDAAVNNAGIGPFVPLERSTDADWWSTLNTNLLGAVRVARAALPQMRHQRSGTIVNISSMAGRLAPIAMHGPYSASKHALCCLTDSLVVECAPYGIAAYCIEPAFFATAIMDKDIVAHLDVDDPYRPVMDSVEQFFRESNAKAPPPDAVSDLIVAAIEGTIAEGVHHPIGMEGFEPSASAARS